MSALSDARSDRSMNWKPVVAAAVLLVGVGVMLETFVPASGRIIDIGAAVFALATWIVPALRFAFARKRRSSLAAVGFTIHIVVLAACLSAIGLLLALLTLVFASASNWAWPAILIIAAFWGTGVVLLSIGGRRSPPAGPRRAD
jgi:hypothetical protein